MKMIIFDEMPLFSVNKDGVETKENIATDSNFKMTVNKDNGFEDACGGKKKKKMVKDEEVIYALMTTSDKVINSRNYDDESIKQNNLNKDWCKPFSRPLLKNHDSYSEPCGRIMDTYIIDHATKGVSTAAVDSLPTEVVQYLVDNGHLADGTSSLIGKVIADEDTHEKILDGLYNTVSQSSYMGKFKCNVCGHDYYGGACMHSAGKSYNLDENGSKTMTCIPKASDFKPVELSIVNNPANDSSIFVVYDKKKCKVVKDFGAAEPKIVISDSKEPETKNEPVVDTAKKIVNNGTVEVNNTKEVNKNMDAQTKMFRALLADAIGKDITDSIGEEFVGPANKYMETITDAEQLLNFKNFVRELQVAKSTKDSIEVVETPATDSEIVAEPVIEPIVESVKDSEQIIIPVVEDKVEEPVVTEPVADAKTEMLKTIVTDSKSEGKIKGKVFGAMMDTFMDNLK